LRRHNSGGSRFSISVIGSGLCFMFVRWVWFCNAITQNRLPLSDDSMTPPLVFSVSSDEERQAGGRVFFWGNNMCFLSRGRENNSSQLVSLLCILFANLRHLESRLHRTPYCSRNSLLLLSDAVAATCACRTLLFFQGSMCT